MTDGASASADEQPEPIGLVQDLLEILKGTSIAELELEHGEIRVHVQREPVHAPPTFGDGLPAAGPDPSAASSEEQSIVSSAYVGEFRRDGDLPAVGDDVAAGAKLGEIYVLGIGNPVLSPTDGTLIELLIPDDAPVEYGQPLAVIRHRIDPPTPSLAGGGGQSG